MTRQRVKVRRAALTEMLLRLLVTVLALATIFYGAMVALAALKLDPDTINRISAYRTIETRLSSISPASITGQDRIIVAVVGVVCLLVFAPLTLRAIPRPYRTRTAIDLDTPEAGNGGPGRTEVAPRTVEQVAEHAAIRHPAVERAHTRYGDEHLHVDVQTTTSERLLELLGDVQHRVRDGLAEHGLPQPAIDVTLTAVDKVADKAKDALDRDSLPELGGRPPVGGAR